MNITIRQVVERDSANLDNFYILFLEEECRNIAGKNDIELMVKEYIKERWLNYWFEDNDGRAFVAISNNNKIIGLLTCKFFDSRNSIIISIMVLSNPYSKKVREMFINKVYEEYSGIKSVFTDVYEKSVDEVEFFKNHGFKIWETSTAPVGKETLNIHLMKKQQT